MENNKSVRNLVLVLLVIVCILFFTIEGFFVYGIMTLIGGILYLLWNNEGNNDNEDNDYYKLK